MSNSFITYSNILYRENMTFSIPRGTASGLLGIQHLLVKARLVKLARTSDGIFGKLLHISMAHKRVRWTSLQTDSLLD